MTGEFSSVSHMSSDFIVYAAVYRLAIIAAGALFLYLGFRLFVLGVMPPEGTNIDGQAGDVRLSIKNAAPGTCFALFGMVLIGLMVWNGNPEMELRQDGDSSEAVFRGSPPSAPAPRVDVGALLADPQSDKDLIRGFADQLGDSAQTLGDSAQPLLGLATVYHRAGRNDEAIALARLLYEFVEDDLDLLELTARIHAARGERAEAQQVFQRMRRSFPAVAARADAIEREVLR